MKKKIQNESTGRGGYTVKFFKFFRVDLKKLSWSQQIVFYSRKELPISRRLGIIACFQKENKLRQFLSIAINLSAQDQECSTKIVKWIQSHFTFKVWKTVFVSINDGCGKSLIQSYSSESCLSLYLFYINKMVCFRSVESI